MNRLRSPPDSNSALITRFLSGRIPPMDDAARWAHVVRAVTGDADALQRLFIDHHDLLLVRIRDHLSVAMKRQLDPEDVAQETYAKAFQAVTACRFDNVAAFHGWLDSLAMNALRDQHRYLRRKKRDVQRDVHAPNRTSESYEQLFDRMTAADSTPSRKVARSEAAATVVSSLARLTEEQREVVRLRFLQDWSVAEVAAQMSKSEAAIHMLCHRALKALRDVMLSMSRFLSDA